MSQPSSSASVPTPPRPKRTGSEYFTPPSNSPALPASSASASPSSKVSAAVSYFESRSRDASPRTSPRKGVIRRLSEGVEELQDRPNVEGSPTPVKGSMMGRRASDGNTPTRVTPRVSSGGPGSPSRIPLAFADGSGRRTPRATPPPVDRTSPTKVGAPSVPAPRRESYGSATASAGPSRIPRPARRVSKSTQNPADISPKSSSSRNIPTTSSPSRIPIPSPRRPSRQLMVSSSSETSLVETAPDKPLVDTPPTLRRASNASLPRSPRTPGFRRTSYRLSASLASAVSTSPTPEPSLGRTRRPSGSSIGSAGSPRRPSGPRRSNHTPRASITSVSSLTVGDTEGMREGGSSTSGRSSVISISEEESERNTHPASSSRSAAPSDQPDPTTPVRPMFIDIPRRTSSVSVQPTSPISPGPQTARPMISPRRWGSSREVTQPVVTAGGGVFGMGRASSSDTKTVSEIGEPPARPPLDAKRRASQAIQLGEISPVRKNRDGQDTSPTIKQIDDSDFMPGAFNGSRLNLAGRRSSQIVIDTAPSSDSDNIPSSSSAQLRHTLPRQSPRLDRNINTLSINTSPTPSPTRPVSVFVPSQPSPPIPARNPLRLSRPGSAASTRPPDVPPRRVTSGTGGLDDAGRRTPSVFLDSPAEVAETDMEESPLGGMYTSRMGEAGMIPLRAEQTPSEETNKMVKGKEGNRGSGDWGWGAKRRRRIMGSGEMEAAGLALNEKTSPAESMSVKELPDIPIPPSTSTISTETIDPAQTVPASPTREPLTPDPIRHHTPTKSPSMPLLGHGSPPSKASRLLGLSPSSSTFAAAQAQMQMRSGTDPTSGQSRLLPPPMLRSPTTPNIISPSLSSGVRPPSTSLSKRSHLIREIAMTERTYAMDLALIRDAFISKTMRPPSTHSVDTAPSPGGGSGESGRTSMHASQSFDSRRTSGYSTHSTLATVPLPVSPLPKSPSGAAELGMNAYFTSSSASLSPLPQVSPRTTSNPVLMGPPIGKPLSPADVRAIFLNIDQLALAAEDLAADFERAIGEEEPGPGSTTREGEGGTDRLGEVFLAHLSRLRPIFTFYCARQSTASTRLVEVQADQSHATYLKDRWDQIKPHTHAWNLDSMLIKPVQRITKYPLLFDDLLACTTPVHPDYFAIRSAAESCKAMALEIDEAKRRKDVVAGVISKKPSSSGGASGAMSKTPSKRGGGLKLFRSKGSAGGGGSTVSLATTFSKTSLVSPSSTSLAPALTSSSSATLIPPSPSDSIPAIPQSSFAEYRQLVEKLEEADQMTRRVGREVVHYTSAAKEVFITQMTMVQTWEKVVRLDGNDPGDKRLRAFRSVGEGLIEASWWELNAEVKDQIIPALSRLLDLVINPRKVILKRDAKASDYARIIQQKDRNRSTDRTLLDSAKEFVALHTQLMEELPAFLEGYIRIFDLTILAFSRAQAKYHASVRDRLEGYSKRWVNLPKSPKSPRRNTVDLNDEPENVSPDTTTPIGIVQAWQSAWTPFSDAMDHFRITRTSRTMADRMADYSQRTGGQGHIRSNSGTSSPVRAGSPSRPDLRHTNSFTSNRSATLVNRSPNGSLRRPDGGNRSRSASLRNPGEGFTVKRTHTGGMDIPQPSTNHLHPTHSRDDADSVDRVSFGLPKISPTEDSQFAGLGLGFTPQTQAQNPAAIPGSLGSMSSIGLNGLGLGMKQDDVHGQVAVVPPTPPQADIATMPKYSDVKDRKSAVLDDDAGEGWRGERVLYQCGAVADFDPSTVGTRRYRKLRFLPVNTGDIIDVFYEVGRIDELPAFPYPEIGVENDGLLVGRKEDGDIGLVICSFLEPLT